MSETSSKHSVMALAFGLIAVFTVIQPIWALRVTTESANVTVLDGDEAKILCRVDRPLQYCRIVVPGVEKALVLSETYDKRPGFAYNGEGLRNGHCGVTIKRVTSANQGEIKCNLGVDGEEIDGSVGLTVALLPTKPELEILSKNQRGHLNINEKFTARCSSRNGMPAAKLAWFLEDEQLTEQLGQANITETPVNKNVSLYTTSQTITRIIRPTDNLKKLICRATHIARSTPQESSEVLYVRYPPQKQDQIRVFGVVLGTTALINVTLLANPRPRVEWTINGVTIYQGRTFSRFEAREPVDLGHGQYNVTLIITELTSGDTATEYGLLVANEEGTQAYSVTISSSEATAGKDIGLVVAASVATAVVMVILVIALVVYLKKKLCFAVNSSKADQSGLECEAQMARQEDDVEDYTDLNKTPLKTNSQTNGDKTAV